ncbi:MAG: NfeD family protein [Oscillospiraceae bacterium]
MAKLFWLIFTIVFVVIEMFTLQFVAISFGVGALLAFIFALFGMNFTFQIIVFLITSTIFTIFFMPLVKKFQVKRITRTNSDAIVGLIGIVLHDICNIKGTGRVVVNGELIPKDSAVFIHAIEGVTLIVTLIEENKIPNEPTHTIIELSEI